MPRRIIIDDVDLMTTEQESSLLEYLNSANIEFEALYYTEADKVKIEVFGGVAELTACPKSAVVEIIDHDNLGGD